MRVQVEACHNELFSDLFDSVKVAFLTQGSLATHDIKMDLARLSYIVSRTCMMLIIHLYINTISLGQIEN